MSVPLLDVQHGEFDVRNLLLQLALGLESKGEQLEAILDSQAPACPNATGPSREGVGDDPLAHLVLGLISLRAKLRRHLTAAADGAGQAEETSSIEADDGSLAEVLR